MIETTGIDWLHWRRSSILQCPNKGALFHIELFLTILALCSSSSLQTPKETLPSAEQTDAGSEGQLSIICSFYGVKEKNISPSFHFPHPFILNQPSLPFKILLQLPHAWWSCQFYFSSAPAFVYCQVFTRKLEEVGRVLFLISLTQKIPTAHKQSHVSMLQEDLLRLPSFPRSAIDAEFSLFSDPQGIRERAFPLLGCLSQCCFVLSWKASPS